MNENLEAPEVPAGSSQSGETGHQGGGAEKPQPQDYYERDSQAFRDQIREHGGTKDQKETAGRIERRDVLKSAFAAARGRESASPSAPRLQGPEVERLAYENPAALIKHASQVLGIDFERYQAQTGVRLGVGKELVSNLAAVHKSIQDHQRVMEVGQRIENFLKSRGLDYSRFPLDLQNKVKAELQYLRAQYPSMAVEDVLQRVINALPEGQQWMKERGANRREVIRSAFRATTLKNDQAPNRKNAIVDFETEYLGRNIDNLQPRQFEKLQLGIAAARAEMPDASDAAVLEAAAKRAGIEGTPSRKWTLRRNQQG